MINYIIQVVLFQVLFLAVYDMWLHRETFFKWNRFYLLFTPVLSFLIPLVQFSSYKNPVSKEMVVWLPEVVLNPQEVIYQAVEAPGQTLNYISIGFVVGLLIFACVFGLKLFKLISLIRNSKKIKQDQYTLVLLENTTKAFSFFNYIFLSAELKEKEGLKIVQHELVHCKQRHTLDLLFFEVFKIAMWFNPLLYIYQNRITVLHEYISDAEVVKANDKQAYFKQLLEETFQVDNIPFINQFYKHSLLKKRITMITKKQSHKLKQLKYLILVPLFGGMLFYSSCETSAMEDNSEVSNIVSDNSSSDTTEIDSSNANDVPFAVVDQSPSFDNCTGTNKQIKECFNRTMQKFIIENFDFKIAENAGLKDGRYKIYAQFKITKEGVVNILGVRAPQKVLEEETRRVLDKLPTLKPGMHQGKAVNVIYMLPISFNIGDVSEENISASDKKEKANGGIPIARMDSPPTFAECNNGTAKEKRSCLSSKLAKIITSGLDVSKVAKSNDKIRVYVKLKIDKAGKVDIESMRSPNEDISDQVKTVINNLPTLIPGKHKGVLVNTSVMLPIIIQ